MSIELHREDQIATITISNPERRNAIDAPASKQMADYIHEVAHDDSIRCVVLTGKGDAFSSGLDLAGDMGDGDLLQEIEVGFNAIAQGLIRMEKPTVAKVSGPAVGAGASIAAACDFVYPIEETFFEWGFTNIGLAPDTGATYILPRLVGVRTALELLITGKRVTAADAVDLGIASETIPASSFDSEVHERAAMLAGRPTQAVATTKRLVYRSHHRAVEETLRAEALAQRTLLDTEDFAEGVAAFMAGRDPEFVGR